MNDSFIELLVPRKTRAQDILIRCLLIAVTAVVAVMTFGYPILMVLLVGAIAADYFLLPRLSVEYEYAYVNGELDVDAVYARSSRKHLASYDLRNVECIAPVNSHELDSYDASWKTVDYTSLDPSTKVYAAVLSSNGTRMKVLLELNEEMLSDLKMRNPRKVFLY